MIIKSPAGTQEPGCGQNILTAYNAGCARVVLANTFMLQWYGAPSLCLVPGSLYDRRSYADQTTQVLW